LVQAWSVIKGILPKVFHGMSYDLLYVYHGQRHQQSNDHEL
jgi:hypothetical protein